MIRFFLRSMLGGGLMFLVFGSADLQAREGRGQTATSQTSAWQTAHPPAKVIDMLLERSNEALQRDDFENALLDLALAMTLGAKVDERFEALLEAAKTDPFAANIERAWRILHPKSRPAPEPVAQSSLDLDMEPDPVREPAVRTNAVSMMIDPSQSFETINAADLLSAPRFSGESIAVLNPGTRLTKKARFGVWAQVALDNGQIGFIALRNLRKLPTGPVLEAQAPAQVDDLADLPATTSTETGNDDAQVTQEPAENTNPRETLIPVPAPKPLLSQEPKRGEEAVLKPAEVSALRDVWIREAAGTGSQTIGVLRAGEAARKISNDGTWAKIITSAGETGFVGLRWLQTKEAATVAN